MTPALQHATHTKLEMPAYAIEVPEKQACLNTHTKLLAFSVPIA